MLKHGAGSVLGRKQFSWTGTVIKKEFDLLVVEVFHDFIIVRLLGLRRQRLHDWPRRSADLLKDFVCLLINRFAWKLAHHQFRYELLEYDAYDAAQRNHRKQNHQHHG